jgi:hypothetical protein
MSICRFCKSEIPPDAARCPHCTSFLAEDQDAESSGKVTYIVDKGLITFLKVSGSVLDFFWSLGSAFIR